MHMKFSTRRSLTACGVALVLGGYSVLAAAEPFFFDDFEDRVIDQPTVGNNWTWYDQWWDGATCTGPAAGGFGPFDDGDSSDYEAANRNYVTADADQSYFRAGLEVPAWEGALSNMLRVYGNPGIQPNTGNCERVLIFQETTLTAEHVGPMVFSFNVAQDQYGAPENGEITGAFVKVLRQSDQTWAELVFNTVETTPPQASSPENVATGFQYIEFEVTEDLVGELLQFGFYNDSTEDLGQDWGKTAALYDNVKLDRPGIGPAHSGSWYNPQQSGHGFSVEFSTISGAPYAVIYWYIYDDQGNPMFFIGQGDDIQGDRAEITFYSPYGMKYGEFDPATVPSPLDVAGTGVFVFSDRDNATFSYTPTEFAATKWGHTTPIVDLPLVKLFGIPAEKYFDTSQ